MRLFGKRTYSLRWSDGASPKLSRSGALTVPPEIMELLRPGMQFTCELTDEGILYRHHLCVQSPGLPTWAKRDGASPVGVLR